MAHGCFLAFPSPNLIPRTSKQNHGTSLSLSSQVYNIAYKLKRDRKQQSLIHDGNHEKPVVRKAESDYCDAKLPIYGDRFIYPRFLYCCIDLIKWVLLTRSKRVNIGNLFFILIIGHY